MPRAEERERRVSPTITVSVATADDIGAIVQINTQLSPRYSHPYRIKSCIENGSVYVAKYGILTVGAMTIYMERNAVVIETLAVGQDYQRQGVGRQLAEKAKEIARNSGKEKVKVGSSRHLQGSWGFYDTLGFNRVGYPIFFGDQDFEYHV
jgi:ribosomal protein S18 acetylase RimI-like enzyme